MKLFIRTDDSVALIVPVNRIPFLRVPSRPVRLLIPDRSYCTSVNVTRLGATCLRLVTQLLRPWTDGSILRAI